MPRLRELAARLIRQDVTRLPGLAFERVETVAEADGVDFECPLGHGHHVRVYFKDRPRLDPELEPLTRWRATGSTLDDLTIEPSIHVNPNAPPPKPGEPDVCRWHGHVRSGSAD